MFAPKHQRQARLELVNVTAARLDFILHNSDVSMANALRRIMISEVPTLSIDLVTIEENTSVHQDEFLAHRLGLLPIDSRDVRNYRAKTECTCTDSCSNCSVQYTLDIQCGEREHMIVSHFDLIPHGQGVPLPVPHEKDLKRVTQSLPDSKLGICIAKLRSNQRIKAELLAIKGIGKLHGKWNPTATVVFKYDAEILIDESRQRTMTGEQKREIMESCPRGVFGLRSRSQMSLKSDFNSNAPMNPSMGHDVPDFYMFGQAAESLDAPDVEDLDLEVIDKMKCIFCGECREACEVLGASNFVQVKHSSDRFHFTVESTGCMPAAQILEMALEVLSAKLRTLTELFVRNASAAAALGIGMPGANIALDGSAGLGMGGLLDLM